MKFKLVLALTALLTALVAVSAVGQDATVALVADNDVDLLIATAGASLIPEADVIDERSEDADGYTCVLAIGSNADAIAESYRSPAPDQVMARGFTGETRWETANMLGTVMRFAEKQCR